MFDPEIVNEYAPDQLLAIKEAIMVLSESGILERQIKAEALRLIDGNPDDSVEEVSAQILRHRAESRGLQLIHNFGQELLKEKPNETE